MRTIKILLTAGVLLTSIAIFASPVTEKKNSIPIVELQELLDDIPFEIEEELIVRVKFRLDIDYEIQVYSISSENQDVNKLLREGLKNKMLTEKGWITEKLYEVPIRLKPQY